MPAAVTGAVPGVACADADALQAVEDEIDQVQMDKSLSRTRASVE